MEMKNSILQAVMEKLTPHGSISARAMFGGYGIYYNKVIFAFIIQGELYFRVDEINQEDFESYNSHPFIYQGARKPVVVSSYMTLPKEVFENPKFLKKYIREAHAASLRYQLKKPKKKTKIAPRKSFKNSLPDFD